MPLFSSLNDSVGVAQHRLQNQGGELYYLLAKKFFGQFFTLSNFCFLMCAMEIIIVPAWIAVSKKRMKHKGALCSTWHMFLAVTTTTGLDEVT